MKMMHSVRFLTSPAMSELVYLRRRYGLICAALLACLLCFPVVGLANEVAPQQGGQQSDGPQPEPASPCDPAMGAPFLYLKKLVVHDFRVRDREMAASLAGIGRDMSDWVLNGLAQTRRFRLANDAGYHFDVRDNVAVRDAARRNNAQLLVVGEFDDLRLTYPLGRIGFSDSFSLTPSANWDVSVRLYVLDGISGQIISEKSYHDAEGRMGAGMPRQRPYQQAGLLGKLLNGFYPVWLHDIQQATACMPLVSQVIQVQGEKALINVGSSALLRAGDYMRAFSERRLNLAEWQEAFHAAVVVERVEADQALIRWEDPDRIEPFYPGMTVRAW